MRRGLIGNIEKSIGFMNFCIFFSFLLLLIFGELELLMRDAADLSVMLERPPSSTTSLRLAGADIEWYLL